MIQAHLHVGFLAKFLIKHVHLSDAIDIWNKTVAFTIFKPIIIMKCRGIKIFAWMFTIPNSKDIVTTLPIVTIEKPESEFFLISFFHGIQFTNLWKCISIDSWFIYFLGTDKPNTSIKWSIKNACIP